MLQNHCLKIKFRLAWHDIYTSLKNVLKFCSTVINKKKVYSSVSASKMQLLKSFHTER